MVETCELANSISDFFECGPSADVGGSAQPGSDSSCYADQGRHEGGKGHKLLQWLKLHPTSPIKHVLNTNAWYNSPFKFWSRSNQTLKTVFHLRCMELIHKSTLDLYQEYMKTDSTSLIFNAPDGNVADYYYSINESVAIMSDLLDYQFCGDEDNVREFLSSLYNVCDKLVAKRNTLFILSPPNAGKNYFIDAVIHFYLNFGQIGNFNKYSSFPLQECVNRRILFWNEPSAEPAAFETLKMLFGGDTCNAKIKYEDDAVIQRTPVIITSNNDCFPTDEAFNSRIFKYTWRQCDLLKKHTKKPFPVAWPLLLQKYNIIEL